MKYGNEACTSCGGSSSALFTLFFLRILVVPRTSDVLEYKPRSKFSIRGEIMEIRHVVRTLSLSAPVVDKVSTTHALGDHGRLCYFLTLGVRCYPRARACIDDVLLHDRSSGTTAHGTRYGCAHNVEASVLVCDFRKPL
ncbi:hypothetical protein P154DRAFT_35950 [Amniculicola lignicola CBS 123094]|uniref:Uncharacterized protein n=1 Tax=Amniculicola lignicola CBS 123094 TaxID=1392246 RepID=A0A6A5WSJ8_9PLEO|nr:hypothetical protein P154DRAFT_35950 [Amniculicola lignicola CBS 123094]